MAKAFAFVHLFGGIENRKCIEINSLYRISRMGGGPGSNGGGVLFLHWRNKKSRVSSISKNFKKCLKLNEKFLNFCKFLRKFCDFLNIFKILKNLGNFGNMDL